MKKPILLLGVLLCVFLIVSLPLRKTLHSAFENEREEYENEEEHETGADKQLASWFQARAYPDPTYLNEKYSLGWEQAEAIRRKQQVATRTQRIASASWSSIGPNQTIGGRVLSIAIDPNNSNNIFIGTASGGIYKTNNAKTSCTWSYVPTASPNYPPVVGVASIVYHPTNSNILLAGTGEVYRSGSATSTGLSNIGFNVWKARGTYSIGILKSTNGGTTWTRAFSKNTSDLWAVQMLKYDPTNSNTVYAAATDGLYKSTDGGNSWSLLYAKTYVSDVGINPANASQIVIAVGNLVDADKGIYRTTNGGTSWTKITSGLPTSYTGYIRFDNIGSTSLYASIGGSNTGNELYLSADFGATWTAKPSSSHCGGQYWFGHDIAVDPSNTSHVVMGGVNYYNYNSSSATSIASSSAPHADVHDIKWDPTPSSTTVWVACDGGIYRSTNNGSSFSNMNNGLAATQFYASIATHPTNASIIIGGLQDNGVVKYNGTSWSQLVGGDGGACAFNPNNGSIVVMSNDARAVYYSSSTGGSPSQKMANLGYGYSTEYDDRTAFMAPVAISKSNPSYVYVGTDNLHISSDGGQSYNRVSPSSTNSLTGMTRPIEQKYKTAIALAVSPSNYKKVYVSTSPFSQKSDDGLNVNGQPNVLVSINADDNAAYAFTSIKSNLPDRFVMDFAVSKTDDDSVFVVLGGYGTSHVWVTGNGGTSWTSIGASPLLPDVPFNAILIDPVDPKIIYAAGDLGVYASPDRGATWYDFNNGLWDNAAMVMDIQPTADNQLVIATHGKGVFVGPRFSNPLPVTLTSFAGEAAANSNKLTWNVAQELNVSHYEVERSADGFNFQKIATVKATNRSTYKYEDVLTANGSYYYRLRIVDNDASYKYSEVIYLKRISKTVVQVLSNPFTDGIKIQLSIAQNSKGQINLYDAAGKLLRSERLSLIPGQSVYTLNDLSTLPSGTYFMEAIINDQRWKQKLLKN